MMPPLRSSNCARRMRGYGKAFLLMINGMDRGFPLVGAVPIAVVSMRPKYGDVRVTATKHYANE